MLQGRFLELRERVWRPFLYLVIHEPPPPPSGPGQGSLQNQSTAKTYAGKCLDLCIKSIHHVPSKHRHHGAWYGSRKLFTKALLLLAAVKSRKIVVPSEWRASVIAAMKGLKYWESEAPDLQEARLTLGSILRDLDGEGQADF